MRKITLICVGNLKEKYLVDATEEYKKRLQKFFDLKIIELPEFKLKDENSFQKGLDIEAYNILTKIKSNNVCSLCIEGEEKSSEDFAQFVEKNSNLGEMYFVIGSSYGLSEKVKKNSTKISFGKMTFPHQLMRVIFLEQLYRAGTIINNTSYHK